MKINEFISTIYFLNNTIDDLYDKLRPLYISRRFHMLHTESEIHHLRRQVRTLQPPITFITLQPACSTFSSDLKLAT